MFLKKYLLKKTIIVIVLIIAALFIGVIASNYIGKHIPAFENKRLTDVKTIEESVRAISELVTLSYNYKDVGEFSDQKIVNWIGPDFPLPFGKKSFIISYDGEMQIGINMKQVSISITDGIIVVDVPSAQIMSHVIKEDSIKLFDEKSGLLNQISITDYTGFMAECKKLMEEKAGVSGLLQQAQLNAKKQLEAFLLSLPHISEEYEFQFTNI